MKCLIVQPIHADGLALLREAGVEPVLCPKPDMTTVAAMIKGCDAVITRDAGLSASAIEAGDRLRVIAVHGTGHDAVDKEAATAKGVLVCNTPGANGRSVWHWPPQDVFPLPTAAKGPGSMAFARRRVFPNCPARPPLSSAGGRLALGSAGC
jgi:hypothetical protein